MTEENKGEAKVVAMKSITIPGQFKSAKDIGYQAARVANEAWSSIFAALTALGVDLLAKDGIPDDIDEELRAGMLLRKHEITKPYWARLEGRDNYVHVQAEDPKPTKKDADKWERFDIQTALAVTSHELGKMKESAPNRRERILALRKDASKYVSNTFKRMRQAAAKEAAGGRTAARLFSVVLDEFLKSLPKKNKAAAARDDASAMDEAVLKRKIAAFISTK